MSENVISLSESCNDGTLQTPKQCLQSAAKTMSQGGELESVSRAMVLALDDTNNQYRVSWFQAGMNMSQCLALLEVAKMQILHEMNFVADPNSIHEDCFK